MNADGSCAGSNEPVVAADDVHWFEALARHMGGTYLRYSFTKGTRQECDHLVEVLGLAPGSMVLDVGCGPGRHARELARRGVIVHGVDVSAEFVELARTDAPAGATFERLDARELSAAGHLWGSFDAAICLCQGAFGLNLDDRHDRAVLAGIVACLKPAGRLALSAFNAFFVVKHHVEADFDPATGVSVEQTVVHNGAGEGKSVSLWTGCYTPRELRLLMDSEGLVIDRLSSVEPGSYGFAEPSVDSPEYLVVAHRS